MKCAIVCYIRPRYNGPPLYFVYLPYHSQCPHANNSSMDRGKYCVYTNLAWLIYNYWSLQCTPASQCGPNLNKISRLYHVKYIHGVVVILNAMVSVLASNGFRDAFTLDIQYFAFPGPWTVVCLPECHDDVIKWKHSPRNWPFVRGIHRSRWIPTQRPVTRSFDVFFDLRLNRRLSKQSWGWWFETLSWSLWRHRNVQVK